MKTKPALLASCLLAALAVTAAAKAEDVSVIAKQDAWTVYLREGNDARMCFAAAQPRLSEPATAKREPIFFYVTAWPREGVKGEVSVKVGYKLKRGSAVTLAVGSSAFKLGTKDDRAFIADSAEERRLLDAMRKATSMTVMGESERGTKTKDTYALAGFGPALDKVAQGCQ